MARIDPGEFEGAVDFIYDNAPVGTDFDTGMFSSELGELSQADYDELMAIVAEGDWDAFSDFCEEHDIHYHG